MNAGELLKLVFELFKNNRNNFKLLEILTEKDILYPFFEYRSIVKNTDYEFNIVDTIIVKNDLTEYILEASDSSLYKLELIFVDKWYLKSYLFQCQSCFGDDKDCNVCGGSGWGVL